MTDNDLIQVLWVEDDQMVINTYPLKAENFGLHLEPCRCWDEARKALESEFDRWSAIILDAKCKYHLDSADNAIEFLREALDDISTICERKGRIIPWYILTGGSETEVSDSINDKRLRWDSDWTEIKHKKHYSKDGDTKALFERIKTHAQKSYRLQVQEMYRDIYNQLSSFNTGVCEDILRILEAVHFPKAHPDFDPKLYYNPIRQALEQIYRTLVKEAIIPDVFIEKDRVILNQCFMYVIGNDAEILGYRNANGKIVPPHIQSMMSLIIHLGNAHSHSSNSSIDLVELSEKEIQDYDNKINSNGGDSKILIFSIALQFCEILMWMIDYIKKHPDKDENRKNWKKIDKTEQENSQKELENGKDYEGRIVKVENDKGIFLNVKCELYPFPLTIKPRQNNLKEDDIVIFKAVQEPNRNNLSKLFWIATEVRLKQ